MKRTAMALILALTLSLGLCVSASAAEYIPDDVTYQNLNGQQLAIKVFTLLPDQDPSSLAEEDFEYDGFLYSHSSTVKEEQTYNEQNLHMRSRRSPSPIPMSWMKPIPRRFIWAPVMISSSSSRT